MIGSGTWRVEPLEFLDGSDQQQQKGKPLEHGFSVSTDTRTSFRVIPGVNGMN